MTSPDQLVATEVIIVGGGAHRPDARARTTMRDQHVAWRGDERPLDVGAAPNKARGATP